MILAYICGILIIVTAMYFLSGIKSDLKSMKVKASTNKVLTSIFTIVVIVFIEIILPIGYFVAAIVDTTANSEDYEKKLHPSAENYEYEGVTLTAYHDTLPLTIEDLRGNGDENYYSKRWDAQESLLICQYTANQDVRKGLDEDMPSLEYTITKVKIPVLYDLCFNQLYDSYDNTGYKDVPDEWKRRLVEIDAGPWGANAAYQVYIGDKAEAKYLICWDTCIVEVNANWQFTREQMGIIAEKLNGI